MRMLDERGDISTAAVYNGSRYPRPPEATLMASEPLPAADPRPVAPSAAWRRWGFVVLLLGGVVLLHASGLYRHLSWEAIRANLDDWQAAARSRPVLAVAAFLAAWLALTSVSMPASVLMLVAGALFGVRLGIGVVLLGGVGGGAIAFLTSRHLFRDWVRGRIGPRLSLLEAGLERDGVWYLLTLRLMPLVPYTLVNVGMALTAMPLRTFAAVTCLGLLPSCLLYVNAGTHLASLERPEDALSPAVVAALVALALLPALLGRLLRRATHSRH